MNKTIRIDLTYFWSSFRNIENFRILFPFLDEYEFIITKDSPDIIFFSNNSSIGNMPHLIGADNMIKVFFTGEAVMTDMNWCDYGFGYNYIDHSNYFRLPNYVTRMFYSKMNFKNLLKPKTEEGMNLYVQGHKSKPFFTNFIYSNPNGKYRNDFFIALSRRVSNSTRRVHSLGAVMNTVGDRLPGHSGNKQTYGYWNYSDKLITQSRYKFSIAMENGRDRMISNYEKIGLGKIGYVTEKLTESMIVGSIPIYWGCPAVSETFNTKSFINCHEYNSVDEVIDRIIEIDNDNNLYEEMLREPWLHNNELPNHLRIDKIKERFEKIFKEL